MTLGLDHKHFARRIMGKGPAHRHAIVFGDQKGAVFFGMAALRFAPMFPRKIGIAAAVGFERRFIVLQSVDEGQDRRFVGGQTGYPNSLSKGDRWNSKHIVVDGNTPGLAGGTFKSRELGIDNLKDVP